MHNIDFTQNASTKGKILCILYRARGHSYDECK